MKKRTRKSGMVAVFGTCLAGAVYGQQPPPREPVPVKRETTVTRETQKNGVTVSRTWQKSSEILGRPITSNRESIGQVEDLVVDVNSGRVIYGVGSFSDVQGDAGRLYPIPWPAGHYSTETRTYDLELETARLEGAPNFTRSQWPDLTDEEFATRTFRSYNQTPWWQTERTTVRTSHPDRPTTTYTERWTQRPTTVHRITELRGRAIRTPEGVVLGPINEVVFDPASGRIVYAVTTRDGQSVPIPWTALRFDKDKNFEVTITAERWKSAPVIETEHWARLSEPTWSREVYRYYEVEPDWDDDDDDDDHEDDDD